MLKKILLIILLVGTTLTFNPISASAETNQVTELKQTRQLLLDKIEVLMAEVERLQALLDEQVLEAPDKEPLVVSRVSYKPYNSTYYKFSYEEIYFWHDTGLINSDGSGTIRNVDKQIYDLFSKVAGEEVFESKIREFRIFNDEDTDVGAFVERIKGTDRWLLAINRFGFNAGDARVVRSFVNLFIHEYAHILLYDYPLFEHEFENDFWSDKDRRHRARVEKADGSDRFKITQRYFEDNENRFVDDYATINEYEDMAETFVYYVLEDIPVGNSLRSKKIRSFYKEVDFVKERRQIRSSLSDLNLL